MANVDFGRYKRIVQGFFDPEPKNEDVSGSAIWCLGKEYKSRPLTPRIKHHQQSQDSGSSNKSGSQVNGFNKYSTQNTQQASEDGALPGCFEAEADNNAEDSAWPTAFLDDCESRIWLTYRSNFPPIKKSSEASMTLSVRLRSLADHQGFTSDTGWGCMIRSGQCLLANALASLRLGRDWRCGIRQEEERQLLSLFADDPMAPFSLHKFVEHGAVACGKHPGEWFGPSATARCIQALSREFGNAGLMVYVNGDGPDVYEDSFFLLANSREGTFVPTLILLGIRLGIDRVTPAYWKALKASLEMPQSIGIAGGRPSSSHYFFAHQGDQFFYLDPHFTRPALPLHSDPAACTAEEAESCHTRRLRRLSLEDMDPSMLLAFLITSEDDWRRWREAIEGAPAKAIVHVADREPLLHRVGTERQSAIDEIEALDDEAGDGDFAGDEGDGEMIERPSN